MEVGTELKEYETSGDIGNSLRTKLALNMIKSLWEEPDGVWNCPYMQAFVNRHNKYYEDEPCMQIKEGDHIGYIAAMIAEMCLDDNF